LAAFYDNVGALVGPSVQAWRQIWQSTVREQTNSTAAVLDALERGDVRHLRESVVLSSPPSDTARWGMCGRLHTHDLHRPVNDGPRLPGSPRV
jgi:hypothetical protein